MYVDETYYNDVFKGEPVESAGFSVLCQRAGEIVEELTLYRLTEEVFPMMPETTQKLVKNAVCAQIEYLDANGGAEMDMGSLQKEFAELNSKIKNFNTDKTLWSGSAMNEYVELSDSIYNFRWIYIETEDGIASPILIRKDKNKYLTGYGYASDSNTIVTVTIKLTINTATNINILSYYADHKFNSGHPNLSAKRVTAIYGVPTYS